MCPDKKIDQDAKEDTINLEGNQNEGIGGTLQETNEKQQGEMLNDFINMGVMNFNPDSFFENVISNYKMARKLYGSSLLRELTGYDPNYLEKNIKIPEFQRKLKNDLQEKAKELQEEKILDKNGEITERGYDLAGLYLYLEELNKLQTQTFLFGDKISKKFFSYGERSSPRKYVIGDSYKNLDIRKIIRQVALKGHRSIEADDLVISNRRAKGNIEIVYALDSSGSMKGKKLELLKRAGIALAYSAIQNKDKIGLVVFSNKINEKIEPNLDFKRIVGAITRIRAFHQTNITEAIQTSIAMFQNRNARWHLLIISDMEPTSGEVPRTDTLKAVEKAMNNDISISLVGIKLSKESEKLAKEIVDICKGKLYILKDYDNVDKIALEDYYSI